MYRGPSIATFDYRKDIEKTTLDPRLKFFESWGKFMENTLKQQLAHRDSWIL